MAGFGTYSGNQKMCCVLLLVSLLCLFRESNARSPWEAHERESSQSTECQTDDELLTLCQTCAKVTRSSLAYPACCSANDLKARKWCRDYIYFSNDDSVGLAVTSPGCGAEVAGAISATVQTFVCVNISVCIVCLYVFTKVFSVPIVQALLNLELDGVVW